MKSIANPILRGFFPDPSVCRVGDDFYIATSTFEWFPGVRLSHSRDLIHWRTLPAPLQRTSQLDMRGVPNSGGVWAPCLTWHDGVFYLVFTNVLRWTGAHKECHNYVVTSDHIEGPWSEPTFLNSSGFDPSFYHEGDKTWLVNMVWDFRLNRNRFGGIVVQEYDRNQHQLVGPILPLFSGTDWAVTEGPHLLKKDAWYYLIVAEGGTFATHAVTVARSLALGGPYETMPGNPLLTSTNDPFNPLQSAGHGCLFDDPEGHWYMAFLCRRPLPNGRSLLGRETSLARIVWDSEGWPRLAQGGQHPAALIEAPPLPSSPWPRGAVRDEFDSSTLSLDYQTLRVPLAADQLSLKARPGFLRLYGRESLQSHFQQSLIARRMQSFQVTATTALEFEPHNFHQMAGITAFYNSHSFYYLYQTWSEHAPRCLGLMRCERDVVTPLLLKEVPIDDWKRVYLQVRIAQGVISFYYTNDLQRWIRIGTDQDASILSDEHALPSGFTGAMVGLACQDLGGSRNFADFDWFEYEELDHPFDEVL